MAASAICLCKFSTLIFSMVILMALAVLPVTACSSVAASQKPATTLPVVGTPTKIIAEGRVEPVRFVQIALNTSGLVSEVMSKEGDQLRAGQIVARLQSNDAQTLEEAQVNASKTLTTAYQNLRDAQYKLDSFDVPSDFTGLTPTEAVSQTLDKLNTARNAFEPYRFIYDPRYGYLNLDDPHNYEIAARRVNRDALEAKKRLDDAWTRYRKAVQWLGLKTDTETAQVNMDQALKDYNALQDLSLSEGTAGVRAALANAEVRAPFAGTLTNLNLKVGQFTAAGQPVLTIADFSNWIVKTTDLTEIDVVSLSEGQPVDVTLDAIPGVTLKGNVLSISQNYTEKQGDIVYEVTVLLTDQNPAMRWGMTAQLKFDR
jgi:multidrug efflux pump subunit AcrA (membrane-fusion protein)